MCRSDDRDGRERIRAQSRAIVAVAGVVVVRQVVLMLLTDFLKRLIQNNREERIVIRRMIGLVARAAVARSVAARAIVVVIHGARASMTALLRCALRHGANRELLHLRLIARRMHHHAAAFLFQRRRASEKGLVSGCGRGLK